MTVPVQTLIRGYHDDEDMICEGCSGRGQCHEGPCVEEVREAMDAIDLGMKTGDAIVAMLGGAK